MNRRLYKSRTERVISGVAGGVAEYFDADPSIVRVIWAILALITGGIFLVVYIVMWVVVPEGGPASAMPAAGEASAAADASVAGAGGPSTWSAQAVHRARRSSGGGSWVFGLLLVVVGLYFLAREYLSWFDVDRLWPLALVGLGILLIVVALRRRPA